MKTIITFLLALQIISTSAFAQEQRNQHFQGTAKADVSLKFFKKKLKLDSASNGVASGGAALGSGVVGYLVGWGLITGAVLPVGLAIGAVSGAAVGVVALTTSIDLGIGSYLVEIEKSKLVKAKLILNTKQWGQGKITGNLRIKGKRKCQDVSMKLAGLENNTGDFELYVDKIGSSSLPIGYLTDYGDTQILSLTQDLAFLSTGRRNTDCNWNLSQFSNLEFN